MTVCSLGDVMVNGSWFAVSRLLKVMSSFGSGLGWDRSHMKRSREVSYSKLCTYNFAHSTLYEYKYIS